MKTITMYRWSSYDAETTVGMRPAWKLYDSTRALDSGEYVDEYEVEVPDYIEVGMTVYGEPSLYRGEEHVDVVATGKGNAPTLMYRDGTMTSCKATAKGGR